MDVTINEIFYSIQGESVHAGLPCVFIRLTGCNLRCSYCDTQYAFFNGMRCSFSRLLEQVRSFDCKLVAITGGEPLIQANTDGLTTALLSKGYRVLVETNGSLNIDRLDRRCSRIMDVKCPSSGEADRNDPANLARLTANDQVKFVVGDRNDFDFALDVLPRLPDSLPDDRILFSPIAGRMEPRRLAGWLLAEHVRARLQLQLHRILWPDRNRGA